MSDIVVRVSLPPQKSEAGMARRLDASMDRVVKRLDRLDTKPDFTPLLRAQDRMLDALYSLRKAVGDSQVDLRPLERSLDRQWSQLRKDLMRVQHPTTQTMRMPEGFHRKMDALAEALAQRPTMRMSPMIGKKLDAIAEAMQRMRPKTFGIMR